MKIGRVYHAQCDNSKEQRHECRVVGLIGDGTDIIQSLSTNAKVLFWYQCSKCEDIAEGCIHDVKHGSVGGQLTKRLYRRLLAAEWTTKDEARCVGCEK